MRPSFILFPRLLSFVYNNEWCSQEQFSAIAMLITPNLRSMHVHIRYRGSAGPGFHVSRPLSVVAERFAKLQSFKLTIYGSESWKSSSWEAHPAPPSIAPLPVKATGMVKFECLNLSLEDSTFKALAALPCLKSLAIRLPTNFQRLKDGLPDPSFPQLESITIAAAFSAYFALSAYITFPRVKMVSLQLTSVPTSEELLKFVPCIANQFSPEQVTSLSVRPLDVEGSRWDRDRLDEEHDVGTARLSILRPLFPFVRLTSLDFSPPSSFKFDDDFSEVAKAWPSLQRLFLGNHIACYVESYPTLLALNSFALHAPQLLALGMPLRLSRRAGTPLPYDISSGIDRKSTRLNSSHSGESRMPSSA